MQAGGQIILETLNILATNISRFTVDGFQMSIKLLTSRSPLPDQEAAVPAHLERSSFFYLLALMERAQCSVY